MSQLQVNRINDASGGVLAPISSVMRNRIINGAMVIDQRNAGASVTPSNQFTLDRWCAILTQASKFTVQQNAGSVTPPVGFSNYLGVTSTSSYSVASGDTFFIYQAIEGYNFADMQFGTANAKTVTLSFWVRSSLTGTFGGALSNEAGNRSYPFSYTISSANTWTQASVTIAGDTTGTWTGATNGNGVNVRFGLGSGSTFSATAGSWGAGNIVQATGDVSVVGTNGATFYITGVQLEVGTQATSFEYRQYQQELSLCQRYFEAGSLWREGTNATSGNFCVFSESFLVQKRASATFTYGNVGGSNSNVSSIQGPEALYEWISPFDQTNARTGFAFRYIPSNATSTIRQYWTASAEL
jgi:hypothetical protein